MRDLGSTKSRTFSKLDSSSIAGLMLDTRRARSKVRRQTTGNGSLYAARFPIPYPSFAGWPALVSISVETTKQWGETRVCDTLF